MDSEAELLTARLNDVLRLGQKRDAFLGFLDESEVALCTDALRGRPDVNAAFWGGYEEAERKILGVFPEYIEFDPELFPLDAVSFSYRKGDALTHRDFLGSIMSLGVERDVVGDILVGNGNAVAFVRRELSDYLCQNITKVGKVGVKIWPGIFEPLPLAREFDILKGVVASERLDCIVALACRISREKASELIRGGTVLHNHRETLAVDKKVGEGDIISVRKKGRFAVEKLGPVTSKGRLSVSLRKYK